MLNLNLKLQSTVLRNQSKVVDEELRALEAAQAVQQLGMVVQYLPAPFVEDDKGAIDALLFFTRMGSKTDILLRAIEATHGLGDSASAYADSSSASGGGIGLVKVCETRTKLARFSVLCKRFAANLARCDGPTFVRMGKVYLELATVERRIDAYVDLAKRDELKEAECGIEVERFTAQAAHLAENYLGEFGLDYGEQQLGTAISVDFELDTLIIGVSSVKQAIALVALDTGGVAPSLAAKTDILRQGGEADVQLELGDYDLEEAVFARLQTLQDAAKANKVLAKKLLRRVDEVAVTSGSLRPEVVDPVDALSPNLRSIALFASKVRS